MLDSLGTTLTYTKVLLQVSLNVKCSYISPGSILATVYPTCTGDVVNNKRRIISKSSLTTLVTQAVSGLWSGLAELKCN